MKKICKSHYTMKRKKLKETMMQEQKEKWENPRGYYLKSILNHESLKYCPECGHEIEYSSTDDEDESYCTHCGLITSASIQYVAGIKIDLPYGLRLG